jgi:hypothetical protein
MHRGEVEAASENLHQLFAVICHAAARPAKSKAGPDKHGKSNLAGEIEPVTKVIDERGLRHVKPDADHRILEKQAIFGLLDGLKLGADQVHVVLVEDAGVSQVNG